MEEILFALGLRSISSILSMILPIVVIIAVVMIVSRLGDIRNDLEKIKKNVNKLRSRAEKKDRYESFDRDLSMSEEEKAIEIAKNELLEHLQKAPEYDEWEKWRTIGGFAIIIFFAYWIIIPESYLGFWSWIRWIVFLLLVGFFVFVGFSMRGEDWEDYERKLKRWERKEKKLQKNLNDLRK